MGASAMPHITAQVRGSQVMCRWHTILFSEVTLDEIGHQI